MPIPIRVLSQYSCDAEDQPDFGPSDALSLGLLCHHSKGLRPFYERAYQATCAGLGLAGPDLLLAMLDTEGYPRLDDGDGGPRSRTIAFRQVTRLRFAMTRYCDEWGSVMEGDIWGSRSRDAALRGEFQAAERAWGRSRPALLAAVPEFDAPLLRMLGWSPDGSVPYRVLVERHGYPRYGDIDF